MFVFLNSSVIVTLISVEFYIIATSRYPSLYGALPIHPNDKHCI